MIGIIGGTGLEDPKILLDAHEKKVSTPFGEPSSAIALGEIHGKKVAVLARHGRKHAINPSNVNYRANIWALKELGCRQILAVTACGSLQEHIHPGEVVFADNFLDWTKQRKSTFFDSDKVCHVPMAEPFCPVLRKSLIASARELNAAHHEKGVIVTIEGPRFSTRAESNFFRSIPADVINMTTVPEVVLAREAGMCYASMALVTDYDCWKTGEESVGVEMILKRLHENAENAKGILVNTIRRMDSTPCACQEFVKNSML